jgi:hypothetical protein
VGKPNRIVVRLGRGDGTFGPEVSYPGVSGWLTVYDVNLDGKLDLVVAEGGDQIGVLLGNGDGTFQDQVVSTVGAGTHPFSLAFGDFNQDGVPDVVVANFGTGTKEAPTTPMMSLLLGIGDGRFEAPLAVGPLMVDTYGVVVADFDRDGKLDFATCNAGFDDMKVSINTSH